MIIELTSENQWSAAYSVLLTLRPNLNKEEFIANRKILLQQNYYLFGIHKHDKIIGIVGFAIQPHVELLHEIWVHDLAVIPSERNKGISRQLLMHIETIAANKGIKRISVHTRIERELSKTYYENKMGYKEHAIVLRKRK